MGLDDRTGDRQAEPGALDPGLQGGGGAEEPVEQLRVLLGGDADARVGDGDHGAAAFALRGEGDGAAGRGVPDRVGQQVVEHLAEPYGVGVHRDPPGQVGVESELLGVGGGPVVVDGLLRQLGQGERPGVEADVTGVEPRQVQQVVDEALQVRALAVDDVGEHELLVVEAGAVLEHLDVAADGSDGGAEFVADHGDELVLHPVEVAQPAHLLLLLDEQALALLVELVALGDVGGDAVDEQAPALEAGYRPGPEPAHDPVGAGGAVLDLRRFPRRQRGPVGFEGGQVVGVDVLPDEGEDVHAGGGAGRRISRCCPGWCRPARSGGRR
ncbi:hypothetical protein GCM10018955_19040 [Planomonospora venezuelensis]